MHLQSLLPTAVTLAVAIVGANAQGPSSTTPVPSGTPIPGNYSGDLRPQIHFSPPTNFMNDPNGMFIDSEGTWHLYYQHNPIEPVAGNVHWGHATSKDLYTWINQPIAIFPGNSSEGVFSGSAVTDPNNTSGFFPNQTNGVVAIYTLNQPNDQNQNLAISYDNGYTFDKFEGNPVLSVGSTQFRDPKVFWYAPTETWVMVLAYAQEFAVGIFTSPNLIEWEAASNFSYTGLLGIQWECPNLVAMPLEGSPDPVWVMTVSINPGAPLGGSITQFYPGDFNGTHFTVVDAVARIADFGKDNYAGQFFYGIPGTEPQVSIAWASNWQYTNVVPSGELEGWRSAMSLPRKNYLKKIVRTGYALVSEPYNALSPVLDRAVEPLASEDDLANGTVIVDFSSVASRAVYFEVNITSIPLVNTTGTANFTFVSSATNESLAGGYYVEGDNPFFLDRGSLNSQFAQTDRFYTDKFSTNVLLDPKLEREQRTFRMAGVLDRSVFEVFLQGGEQSATITVFPESPFDGLVIRTERLNEGVGVSVAVWGLEGTWDGGIVRGNVTDG